MHGCISFLFRTGICLSGNGIYFEKVFILHIKCNQRVADFSIRYLWYGTAMLEYMSHDDSK
jgi:hypothetical protein